MDSTNVKPSRRLLVVDFKRSGKRQGKSARLGAGELGIQDHPALLKEAGFSEVESGDIPFRIRSLAGMGGTRPSNYGFALGRKSLAGEERAAL